LHRPILKRRLGKWAYALIEYDLVFESLKTMKGQVAPDFIIEHRVDIEHGDSLSVDINFISCTSWKLYFDGSTCDKVLPLLLFLLKVIILKLLAD
jgi:hypothetical protein